MHALSESKFFILIKRFLKLFYFQLEFVAIRGSDVQSDIAIDAISTKNGICIRKSDSCLFAVAHWFLDRSFNDIPFLKERETGSKRFVKY